MNRSRSTRKRNQDLELRLGHSELEKQSTLLTSQNVALDNLIIVEDDDDEVQLSSSRIFGHNGVRPSSSRISVQLRNGVSRRTIRVPVIKEEDLELRLGLGGGVFKLELLLPEEYPMAAPKCGCSAGPQQICKIPSDMLQMKLIEWQMNPPAGFQHTATNLLTIYRGG